MSLVLVRELARFMSRLVYNNKIKGLKYADWTSQKLRLFPGCCYKRYD